jgi:hypothetical protein
MVSRKGFTKSALTHAKHAHVTCLTLLPDTTHDFGVEIGDWWYGVIINWTDIKLHIEFADPKKRTDLRDASDALFEGKPVINWFWKKLVVDYRDRARLGQLWMDLPFDQLTPLEINGTSYPVKALGCSAQGIFIKKRTWVGYTGQAFYDWETGKLIVPPGVEIRTEPISTELTEWEDYSGEIPRLENPKRAFSRGVLIKTPYFDEQWPVPNLDQLSTGEIQDRQPVPPIAITEFDTNGPRIRQAIQEASKEVSNRSDSSQDSKIPDVCN